MIDQQEQKILYEYYNEISDLEDDCKSLARKCGKSTSSCSAYGYTYSDYSDLKWEYERLARHCRMSVRNDRPVSWCRPPALL